MAFLMRDSSYHDYLNEDRNLKCSVFIYMREDASWFSGDGARDEIDSIYYDKV